MTASCVYYGGDAQAGYVQRRRRALHHGLEAWQDHRPDCWEGTGGSGVIDSTDMTYVTPIRFVLETTRSSKPLAKAYFRSGQSPWVSLSEVVRGGAVSFLLKYCGTSESLPRLMYTKVIWIKLRTSQGAGPFKNKNNLPNPLIKFGCIVQQSLCCS